MKRNIGSIDRVVRVAVALALFTAAALSPLSLGVRLLALAAPAAVLLLTALTGRCLGYRVLGMSTCRSET
jgi:hypothetical protein